MLLFIIIPASFAPRFVNFNTSHVTVYHKGTQLRKEQTKNFNTSHVTVYRRHTGNDHPVSEFQYISCYCLSVLKYRIRPVEKISIHLMLLFILHTIKQEYQSQYFNTSHVTVYPLASLFIIVFLRFQYISCYCLSTTKLHR